MAGKSSSSGQIISLPKGGGALHGIGEKFSPDLHTGTGNITVPILQDAVLDGKEFFQMELYSPSDAQISKALSKGTIMDDEPIPARPRKADFNHDGEEDLLWRHRAGHLSIWYMDSVTSARL